MNMKKKCIAVGLVVCLFAGTGGVVASAAESGFSSKEDVMSKYVEGVQEGDFYKAQSAYAIENYVDHFSLKKYADSIRAYGPDSMKEIPVIGDMTREINIENRKSAITDTIRKHYLIFTNSPVIMSEDGYQMHTFTEEDDISEYLSESFTDDDRESLDSIRLLGYVDPDYMNTALSEDGFDFSDKINLILERDANIYGADEADSVVGYLENNEGTYLLFMECVRYGDEWYALKYSSPQASITGISVKYAGLMPAADSEEAALDISAISEHLYH